MTITKEQFDALKPGDRVLVEAEVRGEDLMTPPGLKKVAAAGPLVEASDIHSILPRPIRVGDRVMVLTGSGTGAARVVAVDGDYAMVRWHVNDHAHLAHLSELEVIP